MIEYHIVEFDVSACADAYISNTDLKIQHLTLADYVDFSIHSERKKGAVRSYNLLPTPVRRICQIFS